MRSTFKLSFFLKRHIQKKNGMMPVMARITINGTIAQFSCKTEADPKLWDMRTGRVAGRSDHAREINLILDQINAGVEKHYRELVRLDEYVSSEKVRNAFLGTDYRCETLLKVYESFLADFEAMYQSGSRSKSTIIKYRYTYRLLKNFMQHKYNRSDMALRELQPAFITDFEFYLRMVQGLGSTSIWMYMMPLRKAITIAINNGWLNRDPFFAYSIAPDVKDRGFLTKDEIRIIADHKFKCSI